MTTTPSDALPRPLTLADWITKRREYAAAGIPHYVVADVREGHHHIAAFTDPVDDVYTRIDGGASVTLDLAGHDVPVAVTDLLPRHH